MSYPSVYAWQDELSAAEFQAALDTAKQDAERVRKEFVASLPPDFPAYDAEWTTRYGSKDRLIFVFSVVLDLEEDFDTRDYPGEAADAATADLRKRLVGTKVDHWGVFVVTVTGRPRRSSDPLNVRPERTLAERRADDDSERVAGTAGLAAISPRTRRAAKKAHARPSLRGRQLPGRLRAISYPSVYAWQDELSAAEFQAALDAAKEDAERVRQEFAESLPPGSPAYDAEWITRYGSKNRLIFEFSVVLDLDGDDFDIRDYPGEVADAATADLRRRLVGTKVDDWGVYVVTVTGRPRSSCND